MNILENLPDVLTKELVETLCENDSVRVERIVSRGHQSPDNFWYDQNEHEWIMVVQGEGVVEFENPPRDVSMSVGDTLLIKAHEKHRVKFTAPELNTIWLAVFFSGALSKAK